MAKDFDNSYVRFVQARSERTKNTMLSLAFPANIEARFRRLADESHQEQQRIEAADSMPFESYLEKYLANEGLQMK